MGLKVFLLLFGLTSSLFLWGAEGAGFKYRADPRTGAKRLAINLPGGGNPIILTDFDEKPYFGPRNLVDVNRPRERENLVDNNNSRRQNERENLVDNNNSRRNNRPVDEDDDAGPIENFIDVSNRDNNKNNNNADRVNEKLVRPGGGYPSEDVDNDILGQQGQQQRRPPQRPPTRPSRPPQKAPSYGGDDVDGYFYPKPKKPFTLPGESPPRRPPPPPQVGYPDVPLEENFGFGQNSEENVLSGGGRRPFSPANPQQQPSRRPSGGQAPLQPSRRPGSTGRPSTFPTSPSRRPGGNAGVFGQPPRQNFSGQGQGNLPPNSQRGQSGNSGGSGGGGAFRPRPPPPTNPGRNPFNGVRETVFAGANREGGAFAGASRETSFQNSNNNRQPGISSSTGAFGGGGTRLPQRPPPPPLPPQRRPPPPQGGFVMQTNRRVSQSSSSNSSFSSEESSFTSSSNGQQPRPGQGQQNQFSSSGQRGQQGTIRPNNNNGFPPGQRGQSSSPSGFSSNNGGNRGFPPGQRGQSSSSSSGFNSNGGGGNRGFPSGERGQSSSSSSSSGGGSYGGGFDDNENSIGNFVPQNPRDIVAPNFGPGPESELGNNKDISECGQDGQDEYFSHRLGRCVPRSRPSSPPTRRTNSRPPSY